MASCQWGEKSDICKYFLNSTTPWFLSHLSYLDGYDRLQLLIFNFHRLGGSLSMRLTVGHHRSDYLTHTRYLKVNICFFFSFLELHEAWSARWVRHPPVHQQTRFHPVWFLWFCFQGQSRQTGSKPRQANAPLLMYPRCCNTHFVMFYVFFFIHLCMYTRRYVS